MAGDRGDDLAGAAPSEAQRSAAQQPASRPVRQAGVVHAKREGNNARDPRARERAAVVNPAGKAGLAWLFGIAMKAQP
jgi:hypothetical protein